MAVTWTTQRSGNWSLNSQNPSSPWYDGAGGTQYNRNGTPGANNNAGADLVAIASGHALTCDASVTVGDPSNVSSLAIAPAVAGGTGVLNIIPGVTLTVVSNVKQGNATWTVNGAAGQATGIRFNLASAGWWQVSDGGGQANAKLSLQGVANGRIAVTSIGAGLARFTNGATNSSLHDWLNVDASNLGDASNAGVSGALNGGNSPFQFINCTFSNCGGLLTGGYQAANTTFKLDGCTFSGTLTSYSVNHSTYNITKGTGTRLVNNCSFDKGFGSTSYFYQFTITGNVFGAAWSHASSADYPPTQVSGNLIVQSGSSGFYGFASGFSYANVWNYIHIHNPSSQILNAHTLSLTPAATSYEISGLIFDPGNTDAAGDLIFPPVATNAGSTMNVRYNLTLPIAAGSSAGQSCAKLVSCTGDMTKITAAVDHNTVCTTGQGETGVFQWGETSKGRIGMCSSMRSNLAYTPAGQTAGVKVQKTATTGTITGSVAVTNGSTTVTGTGTNFTTALIAGDWVRVATDTIPYKIASVDSGTQLTLVSGYGGSTGSGKTLQPFVQDAIYNAGYTAADYNAGWGLATGTDGKGYNCELAGGKGFSYAPGPNDVSLGGDPFVDSSRNIATWAVARGQATAGDTYQAKVDAAYSYLKAAPAARVAELVAWVKAGWSVKDSALRDAGHDGATIGALPYSAGSVIKRTGVVAAYGRARARRRA